MKTRRWTLGFLAILAIAAAPLLALDANAGDPEPAPAAAAPSVTVADGGTEAGLGADYSVAVPKGPPAYDAVPFPDHKSPRPKDTEWNHADAVAINGLPYGCAALRINEWIRLRCESTLASIGLVGGDRTDVSMRLDPMTEEDAVMGFHRAGEMVFPVRRGDRRLFEWVQVEFGYKGMMSTGVLLVLSEHWLPDEEKPTLIAH
ncbi:hypothetical protein [Polyangium aurulentum]|uniref:hypothetical protein n=1 Tax=Polyangium aurulentum TaxID=2567896 RepID=UPI0010ADAB3C|nr:hypothetical protein [Polyangium aurulentum]UQA62881.1 hypothetical protein E8A73_021475 [Polyangium aurulentum]